MGCKFDSLFNGWLRPYCIDEELTAEFERSGSGPDGEYQWYLDANRTIPIDKEGVSMLPNSFEIYTSLDWHLDHCLFYWRKLYRSKYLGTVLEGKYDNEFHIKHCIMQTLQYIGLSSTATTSAYVYRAADFSADEAYWSSSIREMFIHDHNLKYPDRKSDESSGQYKSSFLKLSSPLTHVLHSKKHAPR